MLPGFWEFLLIVVVVGWIVIPFFYRRTERLRAKRNEIRSRNASNMESNHDHITDADFEEL